MTCQGFDAPQARGAQGAGERLGQVGVDEVGRRGEGGGRAVHRDPRGASGVPHHEAGVRRQEAIVCEEEQQACEVMNEAACS